MSLNGKLIDQYSVTFDFEHRARDESDARELVSVCVLRAELLGSTRTVCSDDCRNLAPFEKFAGRIRAGDFFDGRKLLFDYAIAIGLREVVPVHCLSRDFGLLTAIPTRIRRRDRAPECAEASSNSRMT